jgi:hypothetical protein
MLLLKVKRTPSEIRQISASQTGLGTLDPTFARQEGLSKIV